MKCLLVTIAIGKKYLQQYYYLFYESQKNYAEKCNYDFKVITDFLDKKNTNRDSISLNKILVCNQEWSNNYDFIIFVDADILININSPPIHSYVDYEGRIGIIDEYSQPSKERRILIQKKKGWETSATDYYKIYGFDLQTDMVFNSGVMVMQPKIHKEFLFNIYEKYKTISINRRKINKKATHKDQPYIGYELQKNNLYKVLDNKFNAIWGLTKTDNINNISLNQYFKDNFFIHFAGHTDYDKIKYIQQNPTLNNFQMIKNPKFYCKNKDTYPPFKNGLYLEEYFLKYLLINKVKTKRKYIPAYWTNFQIEGWFNSYKNEMQQSLNEWIDKNPSENGYFTVVQYDDGPKLILPKNTIIYGACSGTVPIPLIYQDINNTLIKIPKKSYNEKEILCSFIGNITCNNVYPNVRQIMFNKFQSNSSFKMIHSGGWTPNVNRDLQKKFIDTTINSKFSLAPRGYGRSSFRFFECFLLGTIPIYIWNDKNWLPFQDIIDYDKLCIVINISQIDELENIIKNIDEEKYKKMWNYYNKIKELFNLEGMTKQIIKYVN